jgi:hypothetical protein
MKMRKLKQELKLVAIAEDLATREFLAVIRYRNVKGLRKKIHVPLARLDDPKALRELLSNAGAYLVADKDESLNAITCLRASKDQAPHWLYPRSVGWFKGRQFVRSQDVIGVAKNGRHVKPPRSLGELAKNLKRAGTLSGWRSEVATPAMQSSRMVTVISAAFAAPLLRTAGIPSFALFVTGLSKIGKSTLTLAAGSVIGFSAEDDLPNFRGSDAGLGELPRDFNDHVLPLNEFSLMRGNAIETRQRLRELTFGLAEGRV